MANADFQTVVEVQPLAFHIGNMPLLTVQQQRRKIDIQLVHPVFDHLPRMPGHRIPSCLLLYQNQWAFSTIYHLKMYG